MFDLRAAYCGTVVVESLEIGGHVGMKGRHFQRLLEEVFSVGGVWLFG